MESQKGKWWKKAVVYQVYPASFKDSNGDGTGDIPGITSKLDYLHSLGIDVLWICPMYESPQIDLGYDISNFEDIHRPYGTLQDMQDLIDGCHERSMRIIIDLVINHTSELHQWFQESKASKDNDKRDWYIWRQAKYDDQGIRKPPNNWRSIFGGSAWTWDEATEEYYLHLFTPKQPDLNWENEAARRAIYASSMEFWLKRGVDGFRIDAVNMYSKPPSHPDAPITNPSMEFQWAETLYCNGPRMHEFLSEMNEVMSSYGEIMTVGELPHTPDRSEVLSYVSAAKKQMNMVFQFDVVCIGYGKDPKFDVVPHDWRLSELKKAVENTQGLIMGTDAWTTSFLENHDQGRSISRFASDKPENRVQAGKMLALMNATLSGTLFVYQGQEIGMVNMPQSWGIEEYKDIESKNFYEEVVKTSKGDSKALEKAKRGLQYLARDHARVPMCWDSSPQGGFSTSTDTWMRVHDLYDQINVADQEKDQSSVLSFWKTALKLRKEWASLLIYGDFELFDLEDEHCFVYAKRSDCNVALVVLNFTKKERDWKAPKEFNGKSFTLLTSTYSGDGKPGELRPYEGRLYVQV
ncbi:maltase [Pseudomassariella vexata]|uniref:Maltase n=1 Tax=Pseudomassariella vexata TaxID=1141098 RepID=A0A1Y2DVL6_9PEZI|nr:maltase [Pseudomassariella vexata]ORY63311.1 maltase [Pseudomassariella vexata]